MKSVRSALSHLLLAVGSIGIIAVTALPEAESSRKASLAENRLVLDKNDVFIFPQLGAEYTNLVSFDYGMGDGTGSGLALFGDESKALGIGISRGDVLTFQQTFPHDLRHRNLEQSDDIFGRRLDELNEGLQPDDQLATTDLSAPFTVADLVGSIEAGDGLLGARISAGHGGVVETDLENIQSGDGQAFGGLTVGYSYLGEVRVDASGSLQIGSGGIFADEDILNASYFLGGLSLRTYIPVDEDVEIGILGDLYRSTAEFTEFDIADDAQDEDDIEERTARSAQTSAMIGVGPSYHLGASTIAAYGVFGLSRQSLDPNTDESKDLVVLRTLAIPGIHLAADVELTEWLYFRTGMQYHFNLSRSVTEIDVEEIEDDEDIERDDVRLSVRSGDMRWRAGIGLQFDNFTIDGTFQSQFLTNGPSFLGGAVGESDEESTGMFTMVSAGYRF